MVSLPHLCRADFELLAAEPATHPPAVSRIKPAPSRRRSPQRSYWAAMPGQPQDRQRSAPFAEFVALAGDRNCWCSACRAACTSATSSSSALAAWCTMSGAASSTSPKLLPRCRNSISCCRSMRRSPSRGGHGHQDLGPAAVDGRLALAARRRPGALVFLGAPVSPAPAGRLETRVRRGPRRTRSSQASCVRPTPGPQAPQVLRVVDDIVQRIGGRHPCDGLRPPSVSASAPGRRPSHTREQSAWHRLQATRADQPETAVARRPEHESCGPAGERHRRHGRAQRRNRCRPAPRDPGKIRNGSVMRYPVWPRPWGQTRVADQRPGRTRMAERKSHRAYSEQPGRPAGIIRQPPCSPQAEGRAIELRGRCRRRSRWRAAA